MYQRSFWTTLRRGLNPVVVTLLTVVLLAVFLMPFLYMIFTSLKTPNQFAAIGSPIWPAEQPTFEYSGENTGTYTWSRPRY